MLLHVSIISFLEFFFLTYSNRKNNFLIDVLGIGLKITDIEPSEEAYRDEFADINLQNEIFDALASKESSISSAFGLISKSAFFIDLVRSMWSGGDV